MRQCPGCRYLVPEGWECCKRCGAGLLVTATAVPPAAAPARTYDDRGSLHLYAPVGVGGGVSQPSWDAAAYSGTVRLGEPTAPGVLPTERPPTEAAAWAPQVDAPRERPFPVVGLLMLLLAAVGGWYAWKTVTAEHVPEAVAAYADGDDGEAYAPIGLGYSAEFPIAPVETGQSFSIEGMTVQAHLATSVVDDEYGVSVAVADLPPSVAGDAARSIDMFAAGAAEGVGGELVEHEQAEHQGYPASDMKIAVSGGAVRARVVVVGSRVYIAMVASPHDGTPGFDRLVESFHIGAAPPAV